MVLLKLGAGVHEFGDDGVVFMLRLAKRDRQWCCF